MLIVADTLDEGRWVPPDYVDESLHPRHEEHAAHISVTHAVTSYNCVLLGHPLLYLGVSPSPVRQDT